VKSAKEHQAHLFTMEKSWPVFDKSVNAAHHVRGGFFS